MRIKSIALAIATLALSTSVNALVMQADYLGVGDGLLTHDVDNSLEWLDVSATVGISSASALSLYSGASFRLATANELVSLFVSAGIDDVWDESTRLSVVGSANTYNNVTSSAGIASAAELYGLLGGGVTNFNGNLWIHGYLADEDANGLSYLSRLMLAPSYARAHVQTNGDSWSATVTHSQIGSWLVRDSASVPEPSILALLSLGLVGIGFTRRKVRS